MDAFKKEPKNISELLDILKKKEREINEDMNNFSDGIYNRIDLLEEEISSNREQIKKIQSKPIDFVENIIKPFLSYFGFPIFSLLFILINSFQSDYSKADTWLILVFLTLDRFKKLLIDKILNLFKGKSHAQL